MKFKRIFTSVLALMGAAILTFSGCNLHPIESKENSSSSVSTVSQSSTNSQVSQSSQPQSTNSVTPAVWKVTDSDGNFIYMMGSIHAADDSTSALPDYFETAFSKCDSLAVEADINAFTSDISKAIELMQNMMYSDGSKIYDHIPKETYDKLVKILKDRNLYMSMYDNYTPMLWTSLMENAAIQDAGLDTNKGLDTVLLSRAAKEKKQVLEVESVNFQMNLLSSLSDEANDYMLGEYAKDGAIEKQAEQVKKLYDNWKKGNLNAENINGDTSETSTTESSLSESLQKELETYEQSMMTDRNKNMADKAAKYMKQDGIVMFVVGSAHFYGDDGILQLMKDKGCTVTQLTEKDAEPLTSAVESSANESSEEISYEDAA